MKKTVSALAAGLLGVSLYAAPATEKQAQLAVDMRAMLAALETIQMSGFYNDHQGMKTGVKRLKEGLKSLHSTDAKSYLPDEKAYADKFAIKRATMIEMYADDMVDSLNHDNMDDALDDYTQILKQCTSCHLRIRPY
jgi:hypothetical protein